MTQLTDPTDVSPIHPEMEADITKFEEMLADYQAGRIPEDVFRVFRLNNGIYGTIRAHQERHYPARVSGTAMAGNPDFAALARAYGFHAERVESTADFPAAFARACGSPTGAVLDLVVSPESLTPKVTLTQMREAAMKARHQA